MEIQEVKILLQRYFNGESSLEDERALEKYFSSENVADELLEYKEFFGGVAELSGELEGTPIEEDIMDFILEQEMKEKTRYRGMWKTVTGIAASVIIVLGSLLIYEQQQKPFKDTFQDPEKAYAYAEKTLQFVSGKYNTGVSELSKTKVFNEALAKVEKPVEIINDAPKPLEEGIKTIQKGLKISENLKENNESTKNE